MDNDESYITTDAGIDLLKYWGETKILGGNGGNNIKI